MSERLLAALRDIIQEDVGNRGLRTDPAGNLITACPHDFHDACTSLGSAPELAVGVLTGFYIPHATPPCGETDGPLGALFLARALVPLGARVVLISDGFCQRALEAGLEASGLKATVPLVTLPAIDPLARWSPVEYQRSFGKCAGSLTHLIALERVGPSHTSQSVRAQPGVTAAVVAQFEREVVAEHHDCCHTMKGRDITTHISPAHLLLEDAARQEPRTVTIGIGDGGNELGMGKLPWSLIRRNIPGGGLVACRVPADHLIVCGVSNWGAYGLAAGVRLLKGLPIDRELFDPECERRLLSVMVEKGPLVDGVSGKPTVSVDGLTFDRYAEPLRRILALA